jgi:hypothetical protein
MNEIEKLKKLIREAKATKDFSWLSHIDVEQTLLFIRNKNKTIPRKNVIDIYSVRGAINKSRGNPIKGFEILLKNLDNTKVERVTIHRMTDKNDCEYLLFTDPDIEELLGALRLVKCEL